MTLSPGIFSCGCAKRHPLINHGQILRPRSQSRLATLLQHLPMNRSNWNDVFETFQFADNERTVSYRSAQHVLKILFVDEMIQTPGTCIRDIKMVSAFFCGKFDIRSVGDTVSKL